MEAINKIEINKIFKIILISLLGTLLLTISAKIKIPFYPVPMTMQTFVVLFLGIALGPKVGLLTLSLYLFEGILGYLFLLEHRKKELVLHISWVQLQVILLVFW